MKVLFVSDAAQNFSAGGFEPLGIMYISSPLRRAGHEVAITEASVGRALTAMEKFRPRICAYSTTTGLHHLYLALNREIKKRYDVFSVFGGPHPTFYPSMIDEEGVDAICVGEGEEAMLDLVNAMERGEPIERIPNFHISRSGVISRNPVRNLVEDLDGLDFPDREAYYSKYRFARSSKMKTFIASRGCPYHCTYCFNHAFNKLYRGKGKIVRFRSVENVIRKISEVRRLYPLELVMFHDSSFIFNDEWLEEFAEKYPPRVGIPFNCNIRPDHVTEKSARNLKRAGCFSVVWAAEAGNDYIRNVIIKRNISKEQMLSASDILHRYKINFEIQNIIGIPGEGLEEAIETLQFNIQCRPDYSWASLLNPYPGTEIYDIASARGLIPEGGIHFEETYHVHSPLLLRNKRELENLQKLFSITVAFPWLKRLVLLLTRLPLSPAYNLLRRIHKGYCLRYRIFYYKISPKEYISLAWRFLTGKAG